MALWLEILQYKIAHFFPRVYHMPVSYTHLEVGDEVIYTGGTYYHDSYGTDPAGRRGPGKKVKITNIAKGLSLIHIYKS